jgi:DHA3 family tetracycline resistance protein-like MFS transporter
MFGQVDAVGQMMGGPLVAGIAAVGSAVASLVTSGLLLTPALFFIQRANSQSTREPDREAEPVPVD